MITISLSLSDELGRVRLRPGPQPGSDYINASFIDVCFFFVGNIECNDTFFTFIGLGLPNFHSILQE